MATHLLKIGLGFEIHLINDIGAEAWFGRRKKCPELVHPRFVLRPGILGECHLDQEIKVPPSIALLQRHPFSGDLEDLVRSEDPSPWLLDMDTSAVEMLEDNSVETAQSFAERYLQRRLQVCTCTREDIVLGLVDREDDVTWFLIWRLVCFSRRHNLLRVSGPRYQAIR